MISARNCFSNVYGDVTTGTAGTTPSAAFPNPAVAPSYQVGIHLKLVGGTSASGQLEGSNDGGTTWASCQASATALAAAGSILVVVAAPFALLRYNPVTNVGGGTVYAFMST